MNTPKWIPKINDEIVKFFEQTRNLERDFRVLGKKFTTDINVDLPDYYVSRLPAIIIVTSRKFSVSLIGTIFHIKNRPLYIEQLYRNAIVTESKHLQCENKMKSENVYSHTTVMMKEIGQKRISVNR